MKIVVAYRGIPGAPGRAFGDVMIGVFRSLGHDATPYGRVYGTADWMGSDASGDLLVSLECNDEDGQYDELRYFPGLRVHWRFDAGMDRPEVIPFINPHITYNTNRRTGGGVYLPVAFDVDGFTPSTSHSGAAIVGTPFAERVRFAHAIGVPMLTPHTNDYPATVARLAVHIHAHNSSGVGSLVSRIWETMGLGVALLAPRTPELEELFQDGVHCCMYDGLADAKIKLAALLGDDERREAMAAHGRAEILRAHTFHHRARRILDDARAL